MMVTAQSNTQTCPMNHNTKGEENTRLLYRLSSPPSGTLLERIGGVATLTDSDRMEEEEEERVSELGLSFTMEDVERFLASVIDTVCSASSTHRTCDQRGGMSSFTIEECRKRLVPVLLASVQAKDPGRRLDPEQCFALLSDDHCRTLMRKAKEMRRQLSFLRSKETPVIHGQSGSLKRDRVHEEDTWVRNTRSRFDSVNTVVSDASRKDSDVTLVDAVGRSPPKAPRAMLQAPQWNHSNSAHNGAPHASLMASPTTEDPAASLIELIRQAIQLYPMLDPTHQAMAENETMNVSEGANMTPPTQPAPARSSDYASHLPTEPGIWFSQQGRPFAQIVEVDMEVSDDMFYLSKERQPSRLRMHLRLCSVPVGAMTNEDGDTSAALTDAIARHTFQWPKKGKLVIQVNQETERSKTWLPHTLESAPLDVTSCVRPGKNIFRFIQLSDLSEFAFVLVASAPPPEEAWRGWDWTSLADAYPSSMDGPVNSPSEPAVTVPT